MTTTVNEPATGRAARPAAGLPRLFPLVPGTPEDLRAHLGRYGRPPYRGGPGLLIGGIEAAGLTGRGGAAFPVHRKLAIVAGARGRKVIVANGAESEPASHKDDLLLRVAPNLVLDGLQLAAEAVGASQAYLYLHPGHHPELLRVFAERSAAGIDRLQVRLAEAPPRFLAGQESAVVNRLGGGPALPTFVPPRVSERGLGGAPTLVQNVETLAHIAQIARYGPRWFRALGTDTEPGSMLTTVYHPHGQGGAREMGPAGRGGTAQDRLPGDTQCQVIEAEIGAPLRTLLVGQADAQADAQAVLIGGFHGTWLPMAQAMALTLDNKALSSRGAAVGAGVIAALPADRCGLAEAARITRYLAAESAGQCGPCLNGLPSIAGALAELAGPRPRRRTRENVERWVGPQNLVTGRGACNHPDGTVRFVRSALKVFARELSRHEQGQCSATSRRPFLPLPAGMPMTEDDWT